MLVFRDWDYSKQDTAKNSNVSFRHTLREIEKLEKTGLIVLSSIPTILINFAIFPESVFIRYMA